MTPPKDPYRTLGLARGATIDEVRAAYRALAKVNHPDVAGPSALPRFLAIKAAYEQLRRAGGARGTASRGAPTPAPPPSSADPDRADATHRAYGGRTRRTRTGPRPSRDRPPAPGSTSPSGTASAGGDGRDGPGKATLGSTSYDGVEGGPFEPDWGGASWYGTTSGTYWTINPKEYADPRKHGPEYQARARRSARARAAAGALGREADGEASEPSVASALGDAPETEGSSPPQDRPATAHVPRSYRPGASSWRDARPVPPPPGGPRPASPDGPPPDLAAAATDLGRALTDERTARGRWRLVQAVVGWLPIAFGLGWLVGEITGCGRFAAACDGAEGVLGPSLALVALGVLALIPAFASIAATAAISVLAVAVPVTLALSAGGAATAPGTRMMVLGVSLVIGWVAGLAFALVRRGGWAGRGGRLDRATFVEPGGPEGPPGPVS